MARLVEDLIGEEQRAGAAGDEHSSPLISPYVTALQPPLGSGPADDGADVAPVADGAADDGGVGTVADVDGGARHAGDGARLHAEAAAADLDAAETVQKENVVK